MLKTRYHKLRLRFSLWYHRRSNWWKEKLGSLQLTRRGLLGIYLLLILCVGVFFTQRWQAGLRSPSGWGGEWPPQEEGEPAPSFTSLWAGRRQPSGSHSDTGALEEDPDAPALIVPPPAPPAAAEETTPTVGALITLEQLQLPIAGAAVQQGFALSAKSATLGDWRPHLAVDFAAERGSQVQAAAAGTVSRLVSDDPYWGTIITIDHGGGWQTSYSNVGQPTVVSGERVSAGQVIGQIVENPPLEMLDELHLHFVLLQNGQAVDPSSKWQE